MQNSFRQVADATPVHYLRCVRLNAVRRQLMSTRAVDLNVAQVAADRGFNHLSHFAQRYKALFGELPSQTTRGRTCASPQDGDGQTTRRERPAPDSGVACVPASQYGSPSTSMER